MCICICSFQFDRQDVEEVLTEPHHFEDVDSGTVLANPSMVLTPDKSPGARTHHHKSSERHFATQTQSKASTPPAGPIKADSRNYLYRSFRNKGFSKSVAETMCQARSQATFKQYSTYLQKWQLYCSERSIHERHPDVKHVLNFLDRMKKDVGFSAISTAKAALASFISFDRKPLGQNKYVSLYMTGLAKSLPRAPKYQDIWDPQEVLKFLKKWSPAKNLNLFQLTVKTLLLLLLVTAQRLQTMSKLSLENMTQKKRKFSFTIVENLKHQRGYAPATIIEVQSFPADLRLCPVNYLKAYLNRTRQVRSTQALFVTTTKPHGKAAMATMSRWVKVGLNLAGINTTKFSPGSTRAASANRALNQGVSIEKILSQGCWAQETTFSKWYKKETQKKVPSFQSAVLSAKRP